MKQLEQARILLAMIARLLELVEQEIAETKP